MTESQRSNAVYVKWIKTAKLGEKHKKKKLSILRLLSANKAWALMKEGANTENKKICSPRLITTSIKNNIWTEKLEKK